jgi:asparagine synthase (glutamine-hydrolysing)
MCGIAGTLTFEPGRRVQPELLAQMRDTMSHRGPDGSGMWVSEDCRVGLAFRRLAIIDLSDAAMQPMRSEDGHLRLVFNGEIYNHAEIRAELERTGTHVWRTDHSDSEVLLHAWEQWGLAALDRLRGMFAFAVWDSRERELWLVRDRMGVKPLYYSVRDGHVSFASEIKALLEDPAQPRAVDEESLFHYLSFLCTPAPNTLFAGIRKVPAASWVRITADGSVSGERWWDPWDHVTPLTDASETEIAERLLAELRTAVQLRKISDVPVGVFLSGGIDSSTNAALFSEGMTSPVRTFSIGYDADYPSYRNELDFARRMASEVGADHHERRLSQADLLDFVPRMIRLQDEPIADPVCVPVHYVSELARENGVIVAQVGEGADELFCGYPMWANAMRVQRLDELPVPRALKSFGLMGMRMLGQDSGTRYEWLRRGAAGQPVFWGGAEAFSQREKERLLSARLRQRFAGSTSWEVIRPIRERFEQKAWEPSSLNWMTYLDLSLRLPELLLMRVDKMSMGVGLEARVPFLDHKVVELALSIPTSVKLADGELKHILKRSVRGVIPTEIIDRPKQGFGVPVNEWLSDSLGARIARTLDRFTRESDLLDAAAVRDILARPGHQKPWYLFNLAAWWQEYIA